MKSSRGIQLLLSVVFALICTTPATCVAFDTNGLVAWWTANGNAQDAAASHSGTLSGGLEFVTGVQGQAFSFNGTDSYVQVSDTEIPKGLIRNCFWARPLVILTIGGRTRGESRGRFRSLAE